SAGAVGRHSDCALFRRRKADRHRPAARPQRQHRPHAAAPRPPGARGMCPRPAGCGGVVMSKLSCDEARLRLSDVLAAVADRAAAAALDTHLAECAACRDHARAYCRLHRALCEMTAEAHHAETATTIQTLLAGETTPAASAPGLAASATQAAGDSRGRHRPFVRWLVVAAALLVAVGAAVWILRPTAPAIARVERVEGEVYALVGDSRQLVAPGQKLRTGQGLQTVGEESGAVVVFADATRLEIGPDSTVGELADGAGKR